MWKQHAVAWTLREEQGRDYQHLVLICVHILSYICIYISCNPLMSDNACADPHPIMMARDLVLTDRSARAHEPDSAVVSL